MRVEMAATYTVLGPLRAEQVTDLDLGSYALHPDGETYYEDVVLDTMSQALISSGHLLHVRHTHGNTLATFRRSTPGSAAGRAREEIAAPLAAEIANDVRQWPAAVRAGVLPLIKDEPLVPLVKLHIHRHTWVVLRDGEPAGELTLDRGSIGAGSRTGSVHEIRATLNEAGTRKDLATLGRALSAQLSLQPQPVSALQRGIALLRQHRRLDGRLPLASVGRHAVHRLLRKLRRSEPIARAGDDTEGVHTMRTTTRRLRTTLRILEESPDFDRKQVRGLRKRLKRLADALGAVRDLDVFLERLDAYTHDHPEQDGGLHLLHDELGERRQAAHAELLSYLESHRLRRVMDELGEFATGHIKPTHHEGTQLVRHFAASAIWQRYEAVLRFETVVAEAPPPTLHALRIACKRLRYTLELFEDELGPGAQPLIKALVKAQDHLGELQDAVVELAMVQSVREHAPEDAGLAAYAATLADRRDRLRHDFPARWQQVSDPGFRQELAALIAGL